MQYLTKQITHNEYIVIQKHRGLLSAVDQRVQ